MADSKVKVAPQRSFEIHVAFMCSKENEVVVMDDRYNKLWSTNSEKEESRKWTHANEGSAPRTYIVRGLYRDGNGEFQESRVHESHGGPSSLIIGYEEDQDNDFNDAVASVGF